MQVLLLLSLQEALELALRQDQESFLRELKGRPLYSTSLQRQELQAAQPQD